MSRENAGQFSIFGNRGTQFKESPAPAPADQDLRNYPGRRKHGKLPAPSVFQSPDSNPSEPTVLALALDAATVDREIIIAGDVIWYQSSTNATDVLKVKYGRQANTAIPFLPGNKIGGVAYQRLYLSWAATAGATAYLILLNSSDGKTPVTVL